MQKVWPGALLALFVAAGAQAADTGPTPSPRYGPAEVIGIVLDALATPDTPTPDAGIRTTFRFASLANRAQTGPFKRFKRMVNNPLYDPLLGHDRAIRGETIVKGDQAIERVRILAEDGTFAAYVFVLSRQPPDAECGNCWLTDAVIRVPTQGKTL